MDIQQLNKELGNIDLYLLDHLLKGHVLPDANILDAGCGEGRNLIYFLNNRYQVYGIDQNPDAIRMLQFIVGANYAPYDKERFTTGDIADMPYADQSFELVISSAVLHFCPSDEVFWSAIQEMTRVLKPGGTLFIRMTSDVGLNLEPSASAQHLLPDGSLRYLIDSSKIEHLTSRFGYEHIEPIKTVVVDQMRSMATLVLRKN
ncbi:hypothetical protein BFP72_12215 [Reichenbachiella sp. 5M10]|uniref:class I SAM-dependent methyltransferase n=1 Tax=Reichenbachiella sp. 5M10 TaxID=1889772 RepID=UPI000C15E53B|nr:class I SAM-dependent methyltransferase [Reichenbachiella sp. 5M10]PIB36104.1 hypothetical protein BFP72_12215 [Reichenbachiella sp. 5M10]